MPNLNKHTKTKSKPKLTANLRTVHMHVNHCAQLLCTIQHRIVLIIFSHNLQTIIIAQVLSVGGRGCLCVRKFRSHSL